MFAMNTLRLVGDLVKRGVALGERARRDAPLQGRCGIDPHGVGWALVVMRGPLISIFSQGEKR